VVRPVTDHRQVALGIVRAYSSESFAWEVADSIRRSGPHVRKT
jgi:hypothetical protein